MGKRGEDLAAAYLEKKGFQILARNYRFEQGEIDLICAEAEEIVFVEVKTRTSEMFGEPEEAVTASKQSQLRKVAEGYCWEFEKEDAFCRFDVVSVLFRNKKAVIHHMRDAF